MGGLDRTGILYLAFGRPYLSMALLSAWTARTTNPKMPICIVTNVVKALPPLDFFDTDRDRLVFLDLPESENRLVKTRLIEYTPFSKTVFLDCDTQVLGDLGVVDLLLDHFDVAMRLNRQPQTKAGKGDRRVFAGVQIAELPHWNSGVILFRSNDRVERFFRCWNHRYRETGSPYDQVSLVEAVFQSEARVLSLDDRWNDSDPVMGRKRWRARCKVFHYASNISDKLLAQILRFDQMLPNAVNGDDTNVTVRFLQQRRQSKRRKLGLLRYAALRMLWAISSPV